MRLVSTKRTQWGREWHQRREWRDGQEGGMRVALGGGTQRRLGGDEAEDGFVTRRGRWGRGWWEARWWEMGLRVDQPFAMCDGAEVGLRADHG